MELCAEKCGSFGKAFDWGSKGCLFEACGRQRLCVVFLSKALYPLLSTCSTQKDI